MNNNFPPCPKCNSSDVKKINYHPLYGFWGLSLVKMVKCNKCRIIYDGKTGTTKSLFYKKIITLVLLFGLGFLVGFIQVIIQFFN